MDTTTRICQATKEPGMPQPVYMATFALSDIKKASHSRRGQFVYIIHHAEEVLYVGSTMGGIYERICGHRSGGRWSKGRLLRGRTNIGVYINSEGRSPLFVTALEFPDHDLFSAEAALLAFLRPRFNDYGVRQPFRRVGR